MFPINETFENTTFHSTDGQKQKMSPYLNTRCNEMKNKQVW